MRRDSRCTEAGPEQGWELSSTSLVALGWQIGCIFSQVIISGWVIYGPCEHRELTTGVSDVTKGPGGSVYFMFFFSHLFSHLVLNVRVMHSSSNLSVVSYIYCRRVYWSSVWILPVYEFILQLSENILWLSLKCPLRGLLLCPHLSAKRLL